MLDPCPTRVSRALFLKLSETNWIGEIFDVQSKSSLPVSESEIDRLVRARVSDEDYISDICDIPGHYDRITYLEAKCDLLTRRNVALEGERARLRELAQRAMYSEEDNPWNGRQQALDQLVEEILEWRTDRFEKGC